MARGGYRPGAGRPKGSRRVKEKAAVPADIKKAARGLKMTPLEYMLEVMNDPTADNARRDRMAIAAAPFKHPRPTQAEDGKKAQAAAAARGLSSDEDWGDDLVAVARPN